MIAAMKQYGADVARRSVRRYVIRGAIVSALFVIGVGYRFVTGRSLNASDADGDVAPRSTAVHHAPAAAHPAAPVTATAATVAAAPAAAAPAPQQGTTAGSPFTPRGIDINAPKRAAQNAVAAENAQLAEQTGQAVPARTAAPISGPGSAMGVPAAPLAAPSGALDVATTSKLGAPVTRETFLYDGIGRRDPFFSLILTDDLRPLLADLRLVGILYQASGNRTVAIMRDLQTNAQYRVTTGTTLGRLRVAQIRQRAVIFSVDEFGLSRQDSLVWSDTTQVRIR